MQKTEIIKTSKILLWIEQREATIRESVAKRVNKKTGKPMKLSSSTAPRDWARFQELQAVRKAIENLSIEPKGMIDVEKFSKQGVNARNENLKPFYAHILPIIANLMNQGKTTSYAIANALNEIGEKTARGKSFTPSQVTLLMKRLEDNTDNLQLSLITDIKK